MKAHNNGFNTSDNQREDTTTTANFDFEKYGIGVEDIKAEVDKHFQAQMKRVFAALYRQPKTMLMVEVETGIMRSNITRYVAKWKKRDCIKIVRLGICPISKSTGVQFLTTNPELFPAIVEPSNTVKL